jgi:hypothetical protein
MQRIINTEQATGTGERDRCLGNQQHYLTEVLSATFDRWQQNDHIVTVDGDIGIVLA